MTKLTKLFLKQVSMVYNGNGLYRIFCSLSSDLSELVWCFKMAGMQWCNECYKKDDWNNIRLHKQAMLQAFWSDALSSCRPSKVTLNKNGLHSSLPCNNKDCYQWCVWMTECRPTVNCSSLLTSLRLHLIKCWWFHQLCVHNGKVVRSEKDLGCTDWQTKVELSFLISEVLCLQVKLHDQTEL